MSSTILKNNKPIDVDSLPRFSAPATFMRLPHTETAKGLDIGIFGVPFDGGTTNRPGARHGPREIRTASSMQRTYNLATGVEPYEICNFGDIGDVPINPLDQHHSLIEIQSFCEEIIRENCLPIAVGGDHLVSLPLLRALGDPSLGLIHLDAHSDTGDYDFTQTKYSHGTPFRRAIEERLLDPQKIVQVGIRGSSNSSEELEWAVAQGITIIGMDQFHQLGVEGVSAMIREVVGNAPVYLTFDIDCFDPAFAPGTGTPEAGGLTSYEGLNLLRRMRGLNFQGADLVEVCPPLDSSGITSILGATVLFEICCLLAESRQKGVSGYAG
ncbi:agmatinase [Paracoccus sp. S4493]|uniref:agmatinase n=1 Tax=Paracoccus sp. S4493 TaxID=579490 RepID=UPI0009FBD015|nr:agmatinase [Paracoccus sp. S4493]